MKKTLLFLLAALLLFAGCASRRAVDIQPGAAAESILQAVEFRDALVKAEDGAAEMYYRMDDSVSDYAIYISGSGATAEEVAVLKVAEQAGLDAAEAVVQTRVEDLRFRFQSYMPEEMAKLAEPVIVAKGNVVVLVVADDALAAKKAVDALFRQ